MLKQEKLKILSDGVYPDGNEELGTKENTENSSLSIYFPTFPYCSTKENHSFWTSPNRWCLHSDRHAEFDLPFKFLVFFLGNLNARINRCQSQIESLKQAEECIQPDRHFS